MNVAGWFFVIYGPLTILVWVTILAVQWHKWDEEDMFFGGLCLIITGTFLLWPFFLFGWWVYHLSHRPHRPKIAKPDKAVKLKRKQRREIAYRRELLAVAQATEESHRRFQEALNDIGEP